jgi:hypothetical protein
MGKRRGTGIGMPFDIESFARCSPFVFHLTYAPNLARIRRIRKLESAATLLRAAGKEDLIRTQREAILPLYLDGDSITLREQLLNWNHIQLDGGWVLDDLVEHLNQQVFFGRSKQDGSLLNGDEHLKGYATPNPLFLRIPFSALVNCNRDRGPAFCKYNSGAARTTKRRPSPRGPDLFLTCENATFGIGDVKEVVFKEVVLLPETTELCVGSWDGPWDALFTNAHSQVM